MSNAAAAVKPPPESTLACYWRLYGGWRSIFTSPYFLAALLLTLACHGIWVKSGWWDTTISVMPNLLGFTLAAFALMVGIGGERFLLLIAGDVDGPSEYSILIASFLHFILVQCSSLVLAFLLKGLAAAPALLPIFEIGGVLARIAWAVGFLMLSYALLLVVATSLRAFELTMSFNDLRTLERAASKGVSKQKQSGCNCAGDS